MAQESSDKREDIIRENTKAIRNYTLVKEDILETKGKLDTLEAKMDENIDKLNKSNKLFRAIPTEQISKPSPALTSLIDSGVELAKGVSTHSEHFISYIKRIRGETDSLLGSAAVTDASGNVMLNVSSSVVQLVSLQYPPIKEVIEELKLPSRIEKRKELESELRKIDRRFADMYVGAWQTMRDTSKQDRYRQASHSMRDLLSQFLDFLAPVEKVEKASWYAPEHNSKKPTQKQRAKYAIMGERSEKMLEEKDIEMITCIIDNTRQTYQDLNKISHARDEEIFKLAESYMERCEEAIRSILELRRKFHN